MYKFHKKGFTLIEMLIVVVIIGILAAALIPRLGSGKARANDAARATGIAQIGTAFGTYVMDYSYAGVPNTGASDDPVFVKYIKDGGLRNPPLDPRNASSTIFGIPTSGYVIQQVRRTPGVPGYIVVAAVEDPSQANWVDIPGVAGPNTNPTPTTTMSSFPLCSKVVQGTAPDLSNKANCIGTAATFRKVIVY